MFVFFFHNFLLSLDRRFYIKKIYRFVVQGDQRRILHPTSPRLPRKCRRSHARPGRVDPRGQQSPLARLVQGSHTQRFLHRNRLQTRVSGPIAPRFFQPPFARPGQDWQTQRYLDCHRHQTRGSGRVAKTRCVGPRHCRPGTMTVIDDAVLWERANCLQSPTPRKSIGAMFQLSSPLLLSSSLPSTASYLETWFYKKKSIALLYKESRRSKYIRQRQQ